MEMRPVGRRAGYVVVAVSAPTDQPGNEGPADGSTGGSRPSMNNRHGGRESFNPEDLPLELSDLPEGGGRPLSVKPGCRLRAEAVYDLTDGPQARPWHEVVSEWRHWYYKYRNKHMEFEGPDGQTVRTQLENSYMPKYGKRYYAKLKDLERGIERTYESLTTVMLTLTASTENANGGPRCPADHMRDIMDGYNAARKQLHKALSGRNWEYARVWEPHESGYGHLHIAVFVEDSRNEIVEPGTFESVMRSHVENCRPAGWEAHRPDGDAVSVNRDVNNLGTYISEYIGIFGEDALKRPMKEQAFYATCWATRTRRVDFSNGAHDLMAKERFRRETGLRPEDRGGRSFEAWRATGDPDNVEAMGGGESGPQEAQNGGESETDEGGSGLDDVPPETEREESGSPSEESGSGWIARSICFVSEGEPLYSGAGCGGVDTRDIVGREEADPPPLIS